MFFGFLWTKQYSGKSDKGFWTHTHLHTPTAHFFNFVWGSVQELVSEVHWAAAQVRQFFQLHFADKENNRAKVPSDDGFPLGGLFIYPHDWLILWLASISSYHGNPSSGMLFVYDESVNSESVNTKVFKQLSAKWRIDPFFFVLIYFCCMIPCISHAYHPIIFSDLWKMNTCPLKKWSPFFIGGNMMSDMWNSSRGVQ